MKSWKDCPWLIKNDGIMSDIVECTLAMIPEKDGTMFTNQYTVLHCLKDHCPIVKQGKEIEDIKERLINLRRVFSSDVYENTKLIKRMRAGTVGLIGGLRKRIEECGKEDKEER